MKNQKGVVLVVALVMLLIVTLLGAAVMRGAGLDLKMANNSQERQQAFNAAEAALSQGEAILMTAGITYTDVHTCAAGTGHCFNSNCQGGYCFFGVNSTASQGSCTVVPASGTPHTEPWTDSTLNVWNDSTKYLSAVQNANLESTGGTKLVAKYIIEFRCYIDGDNGLVSGNQGDALFRVTALGYSAAQHSQVLLQSTFRLKAP